MQKKEIIYFSFLTVHHTYKKTLDETLISVSLSSPE